MRRTYETLWEESGEDEDEDEDGDGDGDGDLDVGVGVGVDEGLDERDVVKDEDREGGTDIGFDELAPAVGSEDESSGREEGEVSEDDGDDDDHAVVSPPRWHREVRESELDRSTLLDY